MNKIINIPALDKIDSNRDGGASIEEFGQALRKANTSIGDSEIGYIFHAANSNLYEELLPCANDECALSDIEFAKLSDTISEYKKLGFDKGFSIDIGRVRECVSANLAGLYEQDLNEERKQTDNYRKLWVGQRNKRIAAYWKGLQPYVPLYDLYWAPMWTRDLHKV